MSKIIVLAEQHEGTLVKASLNAVGAAKTIAEMIGGGFDIAIAGQGLDAAVAGLQGYGAEKIYRIEAESLAGYTAQGYAQAFHQAAEAAGASFVVAASTAKGKDCTPRVASRLKAGQASDISAIESDGGTILYTRPMWAGNIIAKVKVNSDIQVVTIRPTDFDAASGGAGESTVETITPTIGELQMRYIGLDAVKSDRPALADADVVVSGGRGLKEAENFDKVLAPLADKLGAAIGASRAVVDSGWVPNDWQVGQTGKVVAPNLYIAMGISGAIQHIAGMKGSKTIVAINKDPEAAIFQIADYGLVADLFDAVPELTGKI
ncbi:MAG: electron transfer flavoprotein subunit alpha/FixB family protein [Myxococcota bacterium]|nr:electron transfer flavoprotein subunit alpha/FixB family protein [Myxococcota bacterium]